jgi:hypothetical protein
MRWVILPYEGHEVSFSGRKRDQNKLGWLCLKPVRVGGQKVDHIWVAVPEDALLAPIGATIRGYATVKRYWRSSRSEDLGLDQAHSFEISYPESYEIQGMQGMQGGDHGKSS